MLWIAYTIFVLRAVDALLLGYFCFLPHLFLTFNIKEPLHPENIFIIIGQFASCYSVISWKIWPFSTMWSNQTTLYPENYEYPFVGLAKYSFYTSVKHFVRTWDYPITSIIQPFCMHMLISNLDYLNSLLTKRLSLVPASCDDWGYILQRVGKGELPFV